MTALIPLTRAQRLSGPYLAAFYALIDNGVITAHGEPGRRGRLVDARDLRPILRRQKEKIDAVQADLAARAIKLEALIKAGGKITWKPKAAVSPDSGLHFFHAPNPAAKLRFEGNHRAGR
jgi:hypothetical protein